MGPIGNPETSVNDCHLTRVTDQKKGDRDLFTNVFYINQPLGTPTIADFNFMQNIFANLMGGN
jgi:hypothetical protein